MHNTNIYLIANYFQQHTEGFILFYINERNDYADMIRNANGFIECTFGEMAAHQEWRYMIGLYRFTGIEGFDCVLPEPLMEKHGNKIKEYLTNEKYNRPNKEPIYMSEEEFNDYMKFIEKFIKINKKGI